MNIFLPHFGILCLILYKNGVMEITVYFRLDHTRDGKRCRARCFFCLKIFLFMEAETMKNSMDMIMLTAANYTAGLLESVGKNDMAEALCGCVVATMSLRDKLMLQGYSDAYTVLNSALTTAIKDAFFTWADEYGRVKYSGRGNRCAMY